MFNPFYQKKHIPMSWVWTIFQWAACFIPPFFLFQLFLPKPYPPLYPGELAILALAGVGIIQRFYHKQLVSYLTLITPFSLLIPLAGMSCWVHGAKFPAILPVLIKYSIYLLLWPLVIVTFIKSKIWLDRLLITSSLSLLLGIMHANLDLLGLNLTWFRYYSGAVQAAYLLTLLPLIIWRLPRSFKHFTLLLILLVALLLLNPHPGMAFGLVVFSILTVITFKQLLPRLFFFGSVFIVLVLYFNGFFPWLHLNHGYWVSLYEGFKLDYFAGMGVLITHPIWGLGTIELAKSSSQFYSMNPALLAIAQSIDSTYMSIGMELGLIGLALFCVGIFYSPSSLFLKSKYQKQDTTFLWTIRLTLLTSALIIDYFSRFTLMFLGLTIAFLSVFNVPVECNDHE